MGKKLLVFGILGLLLIGSVCASYNYSNPKNEVKEFSVNKLHKQITKIECPRYEWNSKFEDFRSGEITREEMKKYVRSCEW